MRYKPKFFNIFHLLKEVFKLSELSKIASILTPKNPELSGGQIQRLCLARTLLRQADIYLLDEPLSNLYRKISNKIMKLIKELSKDSIVIMNCHHQDDVNLANRVLTI